METKCAHEWTTERTLSGWSMPFCKRCGTKQEVTTLKIFAQRAYQAADLRVSHIPMPERLAFRKRMDAWLKWLGRPSSVL